MTGVQWAHKPQRNAKLNQSRMMTNVLIFHNELPKGHPRRVIIKQVRRGTIHHYTLAYRWAMVREIKGKLS